MPLYEYQCDPCGHRFEVIQKYSDAPIDVCPMCGGSVQKLVSSPAIQFKGSGWYITDYARAGKSDGDKPAPAKTDGEAKGDSKSGEAKPGESKAEGKSDSKTESKSESAPAPKPEPKSPPAAG